MPISIEKRKLSPPQVGEILGVNPDKVLGWIRSGQLKAINLGNGTQRPRYAIDVEDLKIFEQAREVVPTIVKPTRRRRRLGNVTEYF